VVPFVFFVLAIIGVVLLVIGKQTPKENKTYVDAGIALLVIGAVLCVGSIAFLVFVTKN
jgi:glucose uptake protein GlcU